MRAAVIHEIGAAPEIEEVEEPPGGEGRVRVRVLAASLNPADVSISAGAFYAGHPPLPFTPGLEAVGETDEGRRVYVSGDGLGVARHGTVRKVIWAKPEALIEIPARADPAIAAALGTSGLAGWLPIVWKASTGPSDIVLVLGATGSAGSVAVQAARAAGAQRVIATGRHPERLSRIARHADAVVSLTAPDLSRQLVEACAPGASVIFDPLWGQVLESALPSAAIEARIVHVGQSAGATARIASALVRGRRLSLLGYSNFGVPREIAQAAYLDMVERSMEDRLDLPIVRRPLSEIGRAWEALVSGGGKQVIILNQD